MPYPDSLLARGERVVLRKNPSAKVLVWPIIALILIIGGASALIAWSRSWDDSGFTSHTPWLIAAIVIGVVLLVWFVIVPFLRWKTEHFVLSTGHIFFRTGLVRRREHQIPLSRIQNIETKVTFFGRILGYGTLVVESAADQPLEFRNVSQITKVQSTLNQLIADDRSHGHRQGQNDDGEGVDLGYGDDPRAGGYDTGATATRTREYPPSQQPQQYRQPPPQSPPAQTPPAQSGYGQSGGYPQSGYGQSGQGQGGHQQGGQQGSASGYGPPAGGPPNPGWQPDQ